jgi:hypothetical protein
MGDRQTAHLMGIPLRDIVGLLLTMRVISSPGVVSHAQTSWSV